MAYRCECSHPGGDEVSVNVLRLVDFSPVVTGLTVEGPDPLQPGGRGSVGYIAGHLQGLVRAGQTQAVHRIRLRCFTRRHVEKPWIEEAGLIDKTTKRGVTGISDFSRRVIMSLHVESIFRYLETDCQSPSMEAGWNTVPFCGHPDPHEASPKISRGRPR